MNKPWRGGAMPSWVSTIFWAHWRGKNHLALVLTFSYITDSSLVISLALTKWLSVGNRRKTGWDTSRQHNTVANITYLNEGRMLIAEKMSLAFTSYRATFWRFNLAFGSFSEFGIIKHVIFNKSSGHGMLSNWFHQRFNRLLWIYPNEWFGLKLELIPERHLSRRNLTPML